MSAVKDFNRLTRWTVGCLALTALACAPGDGSRGTTSAVTTWSVDSAPLVDIPDTTAAGKVAFSYPVGATRLSDGSIVIADGWDARVQYFDSRGSLRATAGRKGEGPGEFSAPTWLGQCGVDSVFVWDFRLGRMTVLDQAGRYVRSFRVPAEPGDLVTPALMTCSRQGLFALLTIGSDEMSNSFDPAGDTPVHGPLWLADAEGRTLTVVGTVTLGRVRPLGGVAHVAVTADRLFLGTNDSAYVAAYTLDGVAAGTFSLRVARRPPTEANYQKALEQQVAQMLDADARRQMMDVMAPIPMPELVPPYAGMFASPDGTVWIQVSHPGDSTTALRGIHAKGRIVSDLNVSADLRVFEVGGDYVLGASEDALGVPHVVVYRFYPPR